MPDRKFSIALALSQFGINLPSLQSLVTQDLTNDSRSIAKGDIFAATQGTKLSGDSFIEAAIDAGAVLIIKQCKKQEKHGNIVYTRDVPVVKFYQLDNYLAELAALYYQQPAKKLTMVGFTGTNGKTTSCQLAAQLFDYVNVANASAAAVENDTLANEKCAGAVVIGTNGAGKLGQLKKLNNTTPGPTELQRLLADFRADNAAQVCMEVSSHALAQKRIQPELIDIAVFTNLTRDHLDYHKTMENYAAAKAKLFCAETNQAWVFNLDDEQGAHWHKTLESNNKIAYGLADKVRQCEQFVSATDVVYLPSGIEFTLLCKVADQSLVKTVKTVLLGQFNLYNLLSAVAAVVAAKANVNLVADAIEKLVPVSGRMETFETQSGVVVVVDYAHTPDGLENALAACKQHSSGDIHLVFGCGGDRDQGKRPLMAKVAEQGADHLVITNDNPRTELPEQIAEHIKAGLTQASKAEIILDRRAAIEHAMSKAKAGDIVLCAGKGHEDYMILGEQTVDYNERDVVAQLIHELSKTEGETLS